MHDIGPRITDPRPGSGTDPSAERVTDITADIMRWEDEGGRVPEAPADLRPS